ncbi:MAG: AtpZ/AtpI family protein [Candidatus Paceibacterota bacterium]
MDSTQDKAGLEKELLELKRKRDAQVHRIFYLMFEFVFIFGIPGFLGLYLGKLLDERFSTGRILTLSLIALAFVLSWAMIILRYKRVMAGVRATETRIEDIKKKLGNV